MPTDLGPHEVDAPEVLLRVARADQPLPYSQINLAEVSRPSVGNHL